jgi:beta-glucosidase
MTRLDPSTWLPEPALARAFPLDFVWGVAASAYQIEGAISEDGRGPSIWDRFCATPGRIDGGETADVACDHYHRMPADVALLADLGVSAYRFSIGWPRVVPEGTGAVNPRGLDFYERLVDALLARGIAPVPTLFHWDLPAALQDRGGWLRRDTAYAFADFAEAVARRLGDRVGWWITHNEPWCAAYLGHATGEHAPGLRDPRAAADAGHHLLLSHGLAVARLRALGRPDARIGITLDFSPVYPADDMPETHRTAARADAFRNRWFLDPIAGRGYPERLFADLGVRLPPVLEGDMEIIAAPLDFLGVNYYAPWHVQADSIVHADGKEPDDTGRDPKPARTAMGWEISPPALADLLFRLHRDYAFPALVVTENGAAFDDTWDGADHVRDPERKAYLAAHVAEVARVLERGVPVEGYFVWSLLDNFEWARGYSKRFGIVYVDYATQRRILKDSGRWYAALLAARGRTPAGTGE